MARAGGGRRRVRVRCQPEGGPLPEPIAIVGASFALPGGVADWDALRSALAEARPRYGRGRGDRIAGWLDGADLFDPDPFRFADDVARLLDPRVRWLLGAARALAPHGRATGVFLGLGPSEYRELCPPDDPRVATGNEPSAAAGWIAHRFELGGPALVVDTACSSALVALHLACASLRAGECEEALVGAAHLLASDGAWARMDGTGILSPTGRCRPFEADADGTVRAEGGGLLRLRPLSAARDHGEAVLGVILGSAVRHNGGGSGLITPYGPAQDALLRDAMAAAAVSPRDLGWIEAHGTGTAVGDAIELASLQRVFGDRPPIGASKAVFGHLEAAAGLVGLLAALLALRERGGRAGVSAYGLSGTGAHVILGAGDPGRWPSTPIVWERPRALWVGRADPRPTASARAVIAEILGGDPDALPAHRALLDLGLDSLSAVEVARRLGVSPAVILQSRSLADLEAALSATPAPVPASAPTTGGLVAVVGAACRLPGAEDFAAYGDLLWSDRDPIGPASDDRPGMPVGGYLPDVFAFDAERFGWSAAEAEAADPQQRLWLTVAADALESAGLSADGRTGMFVGAAESQYLRRWEEPVVGLGNEGSFIGGRAAHHLGLGGPVVTVNTACSASLVAVHLACRALAAGDCDAAVAGGVSLLMSTEAGRMLDTLGVVSPSGRCRTYDQGADGYVRGEGAGAVVLMRLDDARRRGLPVWGVIRGSAVAHDGRTAGLAVPGPDAWRDVVARAMADAGVGADEISYVEVHGSATPLGDATEVRALGQARGAGPPVWAGCAKTRLGHLEQAAGIAGLLKVLWMFRRRSIAPNLHFRAPAEALPEGVVRVPSSATPWEGPLRAGVSAFGISGTAAHVIVEAGPPAEPPRAAVLRLSGRDADEVSAYAERLAGSEFHEAAAALAARPAGPVRAALARWGDPVLPRRAGTGRVALVFSGAGGGRPAMGRGVLSPADAEACEAVVAPILGPGLARVLLDPEAWTDDIAWQVVATVAAELAWFGQLPFRPVAVAGHSFGEIAAACAAGAFDRDTALRLAALRGRRMREVPPGGAMLAIRGPAPPGFEVAATNGYTGRVLSGPRAALAALAESRPDLDPRWLPVDRAWHSAALDGVVDAFAADLAGLPLGTPQLPLPSGLDGGPARTADPAYWAALLRRPVAFDRVLAAIGALGVDAVVEVGPHPVLLAAVAEELPDVARGATARRDVEPERAWAELLGVLWTAGVDVDEVGRPSPFVPPRPGRKTEYRRTGERPAASAATMTVERWERIEPAGAPTGRWRVVGDGALARAVRAAIEAGGGTVAEPCDGVVFAAEPGDDPEQAYVLGPCAEIARLSPAVRLRWVVREGAPDAALAWGCARAVRWERPDTGVIRLAEGEAPRPIGWGPGEIRWSGGAWAPRFAPAPMPSGSAPSGTWLLIGGTGGIGAALARRWHGAQVIVAARGRVDASDPASVRALAASVGPVDGVVLLAGVLDDRPVDRFDAEAARRVLGPKVTGARAVAEAFPGARVVYVSSASAWSGTAGQSVYAAANAYLDEAARRSGGRATSVALGPVAAVGMAARRGEGLRLAHQRLGVEPLPVDAALAAIEAALAMEGAFAVVAGSLPTLGGRAAPDRAALERAALAAASRVLPRPLTDPDLPLWDAGLDSLAATSLRDLLAQEGIAVPLAAVLRGGSVRGLLAEALGAEQPAPAAEAEAPPAAAGTLAAALSVLALAAAVGWVLMS